MNTPSAAKTIVAPEAVSRMTDQISPRMTLAIPNATARRVDPRNERLTCMLVSPGRTSRAAIRRTPTTGTEIITVRT